MQLQLLVVPYDSGNRSARMGAGPERLIEAGLQRALTDDGHQVQARIAELPADGWHAEIQSSFELMRMLGEQVRSARQNGQLPVVLAGNCNTAVGTLAGLGGRVAVIWFDAHADFNTPETTTSGFLDGNAVAMLTGRCWKRMTESIGLDPIPDNQVCLVGTRDVDTLEAELLEGSRIDVVTPKELRTKLARVLAQIGEHVDDAYVHIDLDVLDAGVANVNSYSVKGGLTVDDVQYALDLIRRQFRIVAITLSAYDPSVDTNGAAAAAAIELVKHAAGLASTA